MNDLLRVGRERVGAYIAFPAGKVRHREFRNGPPVFPDCWRDGRPGLSPEITALQLSMPVLDPLDFEHDERRERDSNYNSNSLSS